MGLAGWFRFRRKDTAPAGRVGAVMRAACSGASTDELLEVAARTLLAAAEASRVGVWLASEANPNQFEGTLVAAGSAPVPAGRHQLDIAAPYLKALLASTDPTVVDLRRVPQAAILEALRRMCTAVWIPLRWREQTLGLVLVAYAFPRQPAAPAPSGAEGAGRLANLMPLRALADELALAVALDRAERKAAQARTELPGVLKSAENGAVGLDTSERVRFANARFPEPVGWDAGCSGALPAVAGRLLPASAPRRSQMLHTERMAVLGQLVSGIAHELNNPLTSILGYAQLLLSHPAALNRRADALRVYQEADRARKIVQNLLRFSRQAEPERSPVDFNEIIERTLALRSYELKVENIVVELDLAPGLPRTWADAHQLQQVVLNLVVNAEQAIAQVPPEEGLCRGRIRIRTRAASRNRLRLEVSDDGPGVPPEIVSRIFDPFFTTKPSSEGTGLGLSIAYALVQEHEGEIYLEKERPQGFSSGATFAVELPALVSEQTALPEPSAQAQPAALAPRAADGRKRNMRVLVVEDEPTVAQLVTDVLTEEGYQVEAMLDAAEGLERVLHQPCDLVICDLKMPRLDGRAFYKALVQAGSPVQRRILFITGDTLARRTFDFLDREGLPYVAKPFLVEELKRAVQQVLESSRPDGSSRESESILPVPSARF